MKIKTMKRLTTAIMVLGMLAIEAVVVYAASVLFFDSESQTSDYSKKDIFEFSVNEFFTGSGEFGPGESKSINPIVTSDASIDSYAVIAVEMPKYGGGGLYTINNSSDWVSWNRGHKTIPGLRLINTTVLFHPVPLRQPWEA